MNDGVGFFVTIFLLVIIISVVVGMGFGASAIYAKYNLWSSSLSGQAQLAEADWNRQIKVREANATFESSKLLAEAEVERAKGVAQANKIIGDSLKGNESYLRYLWIQNLQNDKNQVIYAPTETNLPILEASRLNQKEIVNEH